VKQRPLPIGSDQRGPADIQRIPTAYYEIHWYQTSQDIGPKLTGWVRTECNQPRTLKPLSGDSVSDANVSL
jgi:hypothetical protein